MKTNYLIKELSAGTYQVRVEPPLAFSPITISDVVIVNGEVNTLDTITVE
ncbi:hypothetical protein [Bernardetia sp.]|nr:hypothetical protein [Bernardetia sp.]